MQLLLDNDINIIQMPCAEAEFGNQLVREPKGIGKYNTKEFNEHCENIALKVEKQIRQILSSNYEIIAILGIEQSPSCCVNYIYTNHGMEKRKGLFMEKLYEKIKSENSFIYNLYYKNLDSHLDSTEKIDTDKLYLYYLQEGKCLYCMKPIEIEKLSLKEQM